MVKPKNKKFEKKALLKNKKKSEVLAIDCEYVGAGWLGLDNVLARVSIVNIDGECIYDKYVKPTEEITDYRTFVSGIRPSHLNNEPFQTVQTEVSRLIAGKTIVGHALHNDFAVLQLKHPSQFIRDTSKYMPLRKLVGDGHRTPSLKTLANVILGIQIQTGEHDSIIDAKTALRIYLMYSQKWEEDVKKHIKNIRK